MYYSKYRSIIIIILLVIISFLLLIVFNRQDNQLLQYGSTEKNQVNSVSVKDFGAKGDAVHNDTFAIQSALDYVENMGGGIVNLPSGTYIINDNLLIGSNVTLNGIGKETIIDGILGSEASIGNGLLRNKGHNNNGDFSGASNWGIHNLSINSSDRTFQGIYTDNASDFEISNIWSLGSTLHHWLDINNSKNGYIKNLNFIQDGTSSIQIDGRARIGSEDKGIGNININIDNVYVEKNIDKIRKTNAKYKQSAFHLHRANSSFINISNVHTKNIGTLIYKDDDIFINNLNIENVYMLGSIEPIVILNQKNIAASKNWNIINMTVDDKIFNRNTRNVIQGHNSKNTSQTKNVKINSNYDSISLKNMRCRPFVDLKLGCITSSENNPK